MSTARISFRRPRLGARYGRRNPGHHHLAGADVTAHMQRQYERILESLRYYQKQWSDRRRKSVAAATVRAMAERNPGAIGEWLQGMGIATDDESQAAILTEEFHGRPPRDTIDVEETETYDVHGAVLGFLVGLEIVDEDGEYEIPIEWSYSVHTPWNNVLLVSNPAGTNLEFVGGDQRIEWERVAGSAEASKNLVYVGMVYAISYFADKHHLSGPKSQADGIEYRHEFGEGGGELPHLIYDRRNHKMLMAGGSYTVEPEGITG